MSIYRGTGGSSTTTDETTINAVNQKAAEAATSATNAASSASSASTSASNSATSASQAATSATNAATSASQALQSKNTAGTSATAAQAAQVAAEAAQVEAESAKDTAVTYGSNAVSANTTAQAAKTAAETARDVAKGYRDEILTAEVDAEASAAAAASSEVNAAASEASASLSESNASSSASAAAASAIAADASANDAATSEANAAASETASAASAASASTSATTATNQAIAAATSASAASTSENNAATSASNAATSEANAASSESAAATSASNSASSATASANSASAAAASETAAAASESAAAASEINAAASESSVAANATAAAASETAAANSATAAASSATAASTSETNAAASETAAASSESAAATSATNAAASETAAATSASNSATSATNSANSATASAGSATASATSASAAATSETNAAASETAAAASESAAAASESAAATSATNAAASQTAAASSASAAATSASNAAASETAAASSETASAASASAANAAKDAALAALDSFDDRYLGVKSSDPTLDNDGNALVSGALYFDSVTGVMKVYDGTQWLAAYADLSGALIATANLSDLTNVVTARSSLGLGTAATTASTDYATAAQGALADSALQSFTETDPVYTASSWYTTTNNASNWDTAYGWGNHALAGYADAATVTTALAGKVDDSQVLTNVPAGAVFTDTTYSVGNGGLTEINFTSALNTKLAGIEAGAEVNVPTNLGSGTTSTTVSIVSSTGSGTTVPAATTTTAGALTAADKTKLDGIATNANNYSHPTYAGDDFSIDTGTLSGATVISDIDINVTTDSLGHVTDANAYVATRNLTLANLGYTGATNANYYTHPSYAGDDINLDTGALSGATVISDLDFNVTTDTLGHVTDANATYSTRNLTASDIGAQPAGSYLTTSTGFGGDVSGTYNAIVVANDSHTHDGRYYTESESDSRFVNVTGDTMTGTLYGTTVDLSSSVKIGSEVVLQESTDRSDLLQITSTTSSWGGLQIRNSSNEGRWSLMTDGNSGGWYDDENGDWHIRSYENAQTDLYYNGSVKLSTASGGVNITGALTATGNVTAYSDARLKENLEVIPNALDKVSTLTGYTYDRTDMETDRQTGVIAQEVLEVLPEAVTTGEDGYYGVNYGSMVGLLIEAIKEQQAQIDELKNKLEGK